MFTAAHTLALQCARLLPCTCAHLGGVATVAVTLEQSASLLWPRGAIDTVSVTLFDGHSVL
jgi:hypothetical protein